MTSVLAMKHRVLLWGLYTCPVVWFRHFVVPLWCWKTTMTEALALKPRFLHWGLHTFSKDLGSWTSDLLHVRTFLLQGHVQWCDSDISLSPYSGWQSTLASALALKHRFLQWGLYTFSKRPVLLDMWHPICKTKLQGRVQWCDSDITFYPYSSWQTTLPWH